MDPFESLAHVRDSIEWLLPSKQPRSPSNPSAVYFTSIVGSVAVMAYIPEGMLKGVSCVFADDACRSQPDTLAGAFAANRFRFVHGLQMAAGAVGGRVSAISRVRLLAKANATHFRGLGWPNFRAPIEIARPKAWISPPQWRKMNIVHQAGCDARALNGFFASRIGRTLFWLLRPLGMRQKDVPQIGVSLRLWLADDGCKHVAIAHNYFPKYEVYIDGIRLRLGDTHRPDFRRFDPYQLDVDWRNFIVMQLYAMRAAVFPIFERYPGLFLTGWYKSINNDGRLNWCGNARRLLLLFFEPGRSALSRVEWWWDVEDFVLMLNTLDAPEGGSHGEDNATLRTLWERIAGGVAVWGAERG
jgi:hypothetical protein